MYHWLRHPKTTQEKRQFACARDWPEVAIVKVRGRRSPRMLVDAYDDIPHAEQKNWKKKRKTQWKAA